MSEEDIRAAFVAAGIDTSDLIGKSIEDQRDLLLYQSELRLERAYRIT